MPPKESSIIGFNIKLSTAVPVLESKLYPNFNTGDDFDSNIESSARGDSVLRRITRLKFF